MSIGAQLGHFLCVHCGLVLNGCVTCDLIYDKGALWCKSEDQLKAIG